jgi:flagellar biosynthesis protein FlhF
VKIKKYRATSMPEVMKLVRSELGNDAIILNSRVIQTGGFLGLFKKRGIEVVAALDSPSPQTVNSINKENQYQDNESTPLIKETMKEQKRIPDNDQKVLIGMQEELDELKTLIKSTNFNHNHVNDEKPDGISLPSTILKVKQMLVKQELSNLVIDELINRLMEEWYKQGRNLSYEEVVQFAKKSLIEQINGIPFGRITFNKKYINVVGPTGVGKTTTLAKIASLYVLTYKKKIAFITTDTYRIGAIEQLKTYANILNVPVEVCYNSEDFQLATQKYASYDLVFIDTAGRNFRNAKYVEDLKNMIDFNQDIETYLVLSLTSKQIDIEEIIKQFSEIHIDKFIFTKADETATYGSMYNIIHRENKGVAYITNGQDVPDDLVMVTPEKIVDLIVGAE